jgi:Tol biopolymer transport system component
VEEEVFQMTPHLSQRGVLAFALLVIAIAGSGVAYARTSAAPARTLAPSDPPLAFLLFYGGGQHGEPERGSIFVAGLDGRGLKRLTAPDAFAHAPAWSPRARRIAYAQGLWIFVMDRNGRHRRRIVEGNGDPRWSPDGKRLAFAHLGDKTITIVSVATRTVRHVRPAGTDYVSWGLDWSPDDHTIAFTGYADANSPAQIYTVNADGSGSRTLFFSLPAGVSLDMPRWSPNGKQLLYTWTRDGATFLYLANADGSNARRLTRTDGDRASWSWDGHRVVYGAKDIRLLNLRTGRSEKINLSPCRRYSCQDLDWSRTR